MDNTKEEILILWTPSHKGVEGYWDFTKKAWFFINGEEIKEVVIKFCRPWQVELA